MRSLIRMHNQHTGEGRIRQNSMKSTQMTPADQQIPEDVTHIGSTAHPMDDYSYVSFPALKRSRTWDGRLPGVRWQTPSRPNAPPPRSLTAKKRWFLTRRVPAREPSLC